MTEHGFKAACVQLRTGQDMQANIADAVSLIRKAAGEGADYVLTPEQTSLMELKPKALFSQVRTEDNDLALPAFRALAAELGVWLHIGSLAIRLSDDKAANRSFLIAPDGTIAGARPIRRVTRRLLPNCLGASWVFPSATICAFRIFTAHFRMRARIS